MNLVVLIGNLASEPEVRQTSGGATVANFRLAVQRNFKNQQGNYDADFLPVQCWKNTAEYVNNYLKKGMKVAVEGSIQTRSYDAQDGSKRYVTEVIARSVHNLTPRQEGSASPEIVQAAEAAAAALVGPGFDEVEDSELPF